MPDPEQPDTEPVVARVVGAIDAGVKAAVEATTRRWDDRPGGRARRVRRLARNPLTYLYEVHPKARQAIPRELGVHTVEVDEVAGTAVGPPNQRGGDFLPLRPFRSGNWRTRWQRILAAADGLAILPPIDVQRFAGTYWVLDGHNRVAAALYVGQRSIDANIVELIPKGGKPSATLASFANVVQEGTEIQAALSRRTIGSGSLELPPAEREPERPSSGGAGGSPTKGR
jgi:hypothetical protein